MLLQYEQTFDPYLLLTRSPPGPVAATGSGDEAAGDVVLAGRGQQRDDGGPQQHHQYAAGGHAAAGPARGPAEPRQHLCQLCPNPVVCHHHAGGLCGGQFPSQRGPHADLRPRQPRQ